MNQNVEQLDLSEEMVTIPQRPAPTLEQARLGILPAVERFQSITNFEEWMAAIPHFDGTDEEFEGFSQAINENRADLRKATKESNCE